MFGENHSIPTVSLFTRKIDNEWVTRVTYGNFNKIIFCESFSLIGFRYWTVANINIKVTYSSRQILSPLWKITGLPSGLIETAVIWPTLKTLLGQFGTSFGLGGLSVSVAAKRGVCYKVYLFLLSSPVTEWDELKQYHNFRVVIEFVTDQLLNLIIEMLVYLLGILWLTDNITILNCNE